MHRLLLIAVTILAMLASCSKGDSFYTQDTLLLDAILVDTVPISTMHTLDINYSIANQGFCPLGVAYDANFGLTQCGYIADYETTLSSTSFSFATIDSIRLIIPTNSKQGAFTQPVSIAVYELTERIISSSADTFRSYSHSSVPLAELSSYIPNIKDSITDGSSKIAPSLIIPLPISFAQKLVAKGSYASQEEFKAVFNGLKIIPTSTSPSNGMVMLSLNSSNKIKIYGKNTNNEAITSEFVTGGTNSTTINYSVNSYNGEAHTKLNSTNLDKIYLMGARGYETRIYIPRLDHLAATYNILRAQLEFEVLDTSYSAPSKLGIQRYDSTQAITLRETLPLDYFINSNFSGFRYENNKLLYTIDLTHTLTGSTATPKTFNLTSFETIQSGSLKLDFSNYYPNRIILGGVSSTQKPKLKLYLSKK